MALPVGFVFYIYTSLAYARNGRAFIFLCVLCMMQILEIKKDTERGSGGGTSMELTSKGAGTYW